MLRTQFVAGVSLVLLFLGRAHAFEPSERSRADVKAAVEKALPLLKKAADGHIAKKSCFACHNQTMSMLAISTAQGRGFRFEDADLKKQTKFIAEFLDKNQENYKQGKGQGGQVDTAGYALLTLEFGGWTPDATTEAVVEYLLLRDKDRDHWRPVSNRPPTEASLFTTNYVAVRALKKWGVDAQKERIAKRIDAVRDWLHKTAAKDTEDRVFRLFALAAVGEPTRKRQPAIDELLDSQREDGGWAQIDSMESDAYATATALVALHQAGNLATSEPAYQHGVTFLLKSQQSDGSWHIRTRSKPFQTYYESGFPHGKDQFISAAASGWATTALALTWADEGGAPHAATKLLDFSNAVIVTPGNLASVEEKAIVVLQEEIEKRTGIKLERSTRWPEGERRAIAVGVRSRAKDFAGPYAAAIETTKDPGPEGYSLAVECEPRTAVVIAATDARGVLFGVGRLLRKMELSRGSISVPVDLRLSTAPKYELRGHQLGYRPKVNTFDAWTEAQFDQYIRELALFGANSIEILPPRTDDQRTSEHMKVPPLEMMEKLSRIIDSYGLDVWIWYPNMGKNYTTADSIKEELAEREEIFRRLKRIDHILVPGGDPGSLHPDALFPWLDKVAPTLNRHHPRAKIWVSPQTFEPTRAWLDSFYQQVNAKPPWLGGVCFAPWIPTPLPEMRKIVDSGIKIRNYPDITHCVYCQYPVPNWDLAFALTLHRESYNPRPSAMKTIHNAFASFVCGSLTYSEGINDDVNKFVWSDQDWDPTTPVIDTLRDYTRLFISRDFSDDLAQGFLALEKNWEGPLAVNRQVDVTLQQWQQLEKAVPRDVRNNYRFQMGLLRAYYDAYVKCRLIRETSLEIQALALLRTEPAKRGALAAMDAAESILGLAQTEPVAVDYKKRCEELADQLFASIGSQTSVKKHGAQRRARGAFMDQIDEPLNNAMWLRAQFRLARELTDEPSRLKAIDRIVNRTNPGPGGFYDSLGEPGSENRIVNTMKWQDDPGHLRSPCITFHFNLERPKERDIPVAWKRLACALYATPLKLAYNDLDPNAAYSVRATYSGQASRFMRLVANGKHVICDRIDVRESPTQEFLIPREATAGGRLELMWTCPEGQQSAEVAEVWLIRHGKDRPAANKK